METNENPITLPPLNATKNASCKLERAIIAVLALEYVATFIPMYPALIDVNAPKFFICIFVFLFLCYISLFCNLCMHFFFYLHCLKNQSFKNVIEKKNFAKELTTTDKQHMKDQPLYKPMRKASIAAPPAFQSGMIAPVNISNKNANTTM